MPAQRVAELEFSGLHNNGSKFLSPHLRAGLTVYPLNDKHPFAFNRGAGARKMDWRAGSEATVMAATFTKQMGQAAGRWTATIKPKKAGIQFRDLDVLDGDWVDLSVLRNGIQIPVCRGIVDTVRESGGVVNGATVTTYTLTGRDHGAFFEYPITWNSLWAKGLSDFITGFITERLNWLPGGRPDVLFAALIQGYFKGGSDGAQWELPRSFTEKFPQNVNATTPARLASTRASFGPSGEEAARLTEALKVVTFNAQRGKEGLRGALINEALWTVGEQTLHQTLSDWVNPLLNEWWYDLLMPQAFMPKNGLAAFLSTQSGLFQSRVGVEQAATSDTEDFGTMAAIIRERPFMTRGSVQKSMWSSLPTWTIPTWMVVNSDLGIGGEERYNLFEVIADLGTFPHAEQPSQGVPRWLRSDIRQRGLRPYSQKTGYIVGEEEGDWITERAQWLTLVQDWWGPNPYLRQGTITVKTLLPEIRIGQRILLDPGDPGQVEQFYVEGASLNYTGPDQGAGAGGTTTLIVTRGFRGSDSDLYLATSKLSDSYEATFKPTTP